MIDFLFGMLAGSFLSFLLLQLFTKKIITLGGFRDKAEDPKNYWAFTIAYLGGFIASINLFIYKKYL